MVDRDIIEIHLHLHGDHQTRQTSDVVLVADDDEYGVSGTNREDGMEFYFPFDFP